MPPLLRNIVVGEALMPCPEEIDDRGWQGGRGEARNRIANGEDTASMKFGLLTPYNTAILDLSTGGDLGTLCGSPVFTTCHLIKLNDI